MTTTTEQPLYPHIHTSYQKYVFGTLISRHTWHITRYGEDLVS